MEAIFVLSELGTPEAEGGLLGIARDGGMDSEARCAAVWGLGVLVRFSKRHRQTETRGRRL
jgi:hypothetical protein